MKRKGLAWLLGALVVVCGALPLLSQDGRTINSVILQGRAWTFSAMQTLKAGTTHLAGPQSAWSIPQIPAVTFSADFSVANPTDAGTITGQSTLFGSCVNGEKYKGYHTWLTPNGETLVSPASNEWTMTIASNGKMSYSRASPPALATAWSLYWSKASESHAVLRRMTANLPIATTASNISCTGSVSPPATNSTGVAELGHLQSQSWRMAQYTAGSPGTIVQDVFRFGFDLGYPYWSRDGGVTTAALALDGTKTRRVCQTCRYSDPNTGVVDAISSITDASATNRYTVYVAAGDWNGTGGIPAYVSVVGESRYGTIINGAQFAADSEGAGIANMVLKGHIDLATGGARRNNFVSHVSVGQRNSNYQVADAFIDTSGEAPVNLWVTNSESWTAQDTHNYGQRVAYVGAWNNWNASGASGDIRTYRLTGPIMRIQEFYSTFSMVVGGTDGTGSAFVTWKNLLTFDSPEVAPLIRLVDCRGTLDITATGRTSTNASAILINDPPTYGVPTVVDIRGSEFIVNTASAGETINGIKVANDADADNWTINLTDTRISLSGGTARYDVANERAGLNVTLDRVDHAGNYTGAGNVIVRRSPLTTGVVRDDGLAAKPASCRVGDTYIDNTGGAVALCLCTVAGTPGTWEAQGAGTCN